MRKFLLPLIIATVTCTAAVAQESPAKPVASESKTSPVADELTQQKRQLSGELKGAMGHAQSLTKRATELSAGAAGVDFEKYTAAAAALKGLQGRISEQLDLVNKATSADSERVFGTAREQISGFRKELDAHKSTLSGATLEKVPTSK